MCIRDRLTCDLVVDRISKPDAAKGYVLDGFPRTIPQAEALTKALEARGEKIDYAINVEVPEDVYKRQGSDHEENSSESTGQSLQNPEEKQPHHDCVRREIRRTCHGTES